MTRNDWMFWVVCALVLTLLLHFGAFPQEFSLFSRFVLAVGFVTVAALVWRQENEKRSKRLVQAGSSASRRKVPIRGQSVPTDTTKPTPPVEPEPPVPDPIPTPEQQQQSRLMKVLTRGHDSILTTPFHAQRRHQSMEEDLRWPDQRRHYMLLSNTDPHIKREDGKVYRGHLPTGTPLF